MYNITVGNTAVCYMWRLLRESILEFPGGAAGSGSGVVTAVAWVHSLVQELPHATAVAKKKKNPKTKNKTKKGRVNPKKRSHHKEKRKFFLFYLYEMTYANKNYWSNHFTIYVSETVKLIYGYKSITS